MDHLAQTQPAVEQRPDAPIPAANAVCESAGTAADSLAILIHEVSQPLMVISDYVAVAKRTASPDVSLSEVGKYLDKLSLWVGYVGDVVHRLEVLSGAKSVEASPTDLNEVARDAVSLVRPEAECTQVEILTELQPDVPLALVDRVLVIQSLRNVIQNAVQAAAAARMDNPRVTVSTGAREAGELIVRVSDNGEGIPQNAMMDVFDRLLSTKPGGHGIGLHLAKEIADVLGGKIWGERNPDRGMTFSLTFPAAHRESGTSREPAERIDVVPVKPVPPASSPVSTSPTP